MRPTEQLKVKIAGAETRSDVSGSVPVRMQRIGVSKTLTRFRLTTANDVDDREVANGQNPKDVEHSKGRGNGVSTHKEAEDCV